MRATAHPKRTPWGDAWCRQCQRASRVGQWLSHANLCPHCGACGCNRMLWALLRPYHPGWPLHPVLGHLYPTVERIAHQNE